MTTRYEAELQEIERKLRTPSLAVKVGAAEREHLRIQRERERLREELLPQVGNEIRCQWLDGEPKKWEPARASISFGGTSDVFDVNPYETVDGKERLRSDVVRNGYEKVVEAWALWKWNTARCAEVDDSDRYIMDVDPPVFVWEEAVKPKRQYNRKVESGAHAE